jgi:NAD(P)-dependent dehydrogenase (short-subunit alcohol dehydrogenase family)
MSARVLIIGGYGHFGSFIARRLAPDPEIRLIIAGRSPEKAGKLADQLGAEACVLDIAAPFEDEMQAIGPDIVIHTSGPFQGQDYRVAEACIVQGSHYIDLADGRSFVAGIGALDRAAASAGVLAVSGASSVPALTSAVIDHFRPRFSGLDTVEAAISTAQLARPGVATTRAVLGYAGKPFEILQGGKTNVVYGWQDLHSRQFPGIGRRYLGNCDIPDLVLFPERYPELETVRFSAGLELSFMQAGLWLMSWLVRAGVIGNLGRYAGLLQALAAWFDPIGSGDSGFLMRLTGRNNEGSRKTEQFHIAAHSGDGGYIPCIPSILLARRLARDEIGRRGAMACMGLISLPDYLDALSGLDIEHAAFV